MVTSNNASRKLNGNVKRSNVNEMYKLYNRVRHADCFIAHRHSIGEPSLDKVKYKSVDYPFRRHSSRVGQEIDARLASFLPACLPAISETSPGPFSSCPRRNRCSPQKTERFPFFHTYSCIRSIITTTRPFRRIACKEINALLVKFTCLAFWSVNLRGHLFANYLRVWNVPWQLPEKMY